MIELSPFWRPTARGTASPLGQVMSHDVTRSAINLSAAVDAAVFPDDQLVCLTHYQIYIDAGVGRTVLNYLVYVADRRQAAFTPRMVLRRALNIGVREVTFGDIVDVAMIGSDDVLVFQVNFDAVAPAGILTYSMSGWSVPRGNLGRFVPERLQVI